MDFDSARDGFMAYLSAERGYSQHTVKAYSSDLSAPVSYTH